MDGRGASNKRPVVLINISVAETFSYSRHTMTALRDGNYSQRFFSSFFSRGGIHSTYSMCAFNTSVYHGGSMILVDIGVHRCIKFDFGSDKVRAAQCAICALK